MKESEVLKKQLQLMSERIMIEGARMPSESLIIDYDNGGGQCGVRENPYYPAYEKLLSSFIKALDALRNIGGEETEVERLDALRARFKVAR